MRLHPRDFVRSERALTSAFRRRQRALAGRPKTQRASRCLYDREQCLGPVDESTPIDVLCAAIVAKDAAIGISRGTKIPRGRWHVAGPRPLVRLTDQTLSCTA